MTFRRSAVSISTVSSFTLSIFTLSSFTLSILAASLMLASWDAEAAKSSTDYAAAHNHGCVPGNRTAICAANFAGDECYSADRGDRYER